MATLSLESHPPTNYNVYVNVMSKLCLLQNKKICTFDPPLNHYCQNLRCTCSFELIFLYGDAVSM